MRVTRWPNNRRHFCERFGRIVDTVDGRDAGAPSALEQRDLRRQRQDRSVFAIEYGAAFGRGPGRVATRSTMRFQIVIRRCRMSESVQPERLGHQVVAVQNVEDAVSKAWETFRNDIRH